MQQFAGRIDDKAVYVGIGELCLSEQILTHFPLMMYALVDHHDLLVDCAAILQ